MGMKEWWLYLAAGEATDGDDHFEVLTVSKCFVRVCDCDEAAVRVQKSKVRL
jgi:hypothetical protein